MLVLGRPMGLTGLSPMEVVARRGGERQGREEEGLPSSAITIIIS